ncbi:MAG: MerR family transcriptional regulator [Myxococcales bacterium]|nr:MerR family transcriptional regulator [Myxococcales bacterium]
MNYKVEDLAAASGVKIDTIRFYQGKDLIPAPARQGRNAIYGPAHLARLHQIRSLMGQGFSLAQIQRVPAPGDTTETRAEGESEAPREALLHALAEQRVGESKFQRSELAARAGVPEDLVAAAQAAGVLEPILQDGEELFSSADLEMLESGLAVLGAGLPLGEFLNLAAQHDRNIREVSELGIDLFDNHVRKMAPNGEDPEVVAQAFRDLLPRLTRLVALHFQRTLVNRAMERLRAKGEGPALARALAAVEATNLEGEWRR